MEDPYKISGSNNTSGQPPVVSGGQPIFSSPEVPTPASNSGSNIMFTGGIAPKSRNYKKTMLLICGIVIAIVVIVLAVIVVVMLRPSANSNSPGALVNNYLSLVISGTNSTDNVLGQLSVDAIEDSGQKNLYYFAHYAPLSSEGIEYYNQLQNMLESIQSLSANDSTLTDEQKLQIEYLSDDSRNMLSYYFVGSALYDTNAGYAYFLEHKSLDGFLSEYQYPFVERDDNFLTSVKIAIDSLYENRKKFYDAVAKSTCLKSNGIDYECVSELDSETILNLELNNHSFTANLKIQVEQILDLIIADANNLSAIINGASHE